MGSRLDMTADWCSAITNIHILIGTPTVKSIIIRFMSLFIQQETFTACNPAQLFIQKYP